MFIYNNKHQSISSEVYRSIRTNLKYVSLDNKAKTIAITSSLPAEGKSTITGNLALCLSEGGSKVLIIDCDLRKPTIHKRFQCSNEIGLTDALINHDLLEKAIYVYSPRLSVLTTGTIPPNPAEILGSRTFERFLKEISTNFDYVLLDTPPVLAVTDGRLVAAKTDGTVVVVRYGKTKVKQVNRAYEELKIVKANIIGSILNVCDGKENDAYYGYYGGKRKIFKRNKNKKSKGQALELKNFEFISEMS